MSGYPTDQGNPAGAIPVYVASGPGVSPGAALATEVVTGGTAVIVATGPISGGYIANPPNAAAQGIGAPENLYVDMVGVPGSTDATANGTTSIILPGSSFNIPPLAAGKSIRVNAATSGHLFTAVIQ